MQTPNDGDKLTCIFCKGEAIFHERGQYGDDYIACSGPCGNIYYWLGLEEKGMKVAYIAMPYRAPTTWEIRLNIQRAEHLAMKYWRLGYAVICPHKNTAHFDGGAEDRVWLDGNLEILKRCDVIVMGYGWKKSSGAKNELKLAEEIGLEIIYDEEIKKEKCKICHGGKHYVGRSGVIHKCECVGGWIPDSEKPKNPPKRR